MKEQTKDPVAQLWDMMENDIYLNDNNITTQDIARYCEFFRASLATARENQEKLDMAKAYRMIDRFRKEASVAQNLLMFSEMDKQAKYMENWAEKLGIDLNVIADEFYGEAD